MTDYERIEKVIGFLIAHQGEQPDLATLAKVAGLSKFHFQRLFTRWAGVSPKMFLKFITALHAKSLLRDSTSVLDASYEVGLSGPGRLHDLLVTIDGVSPGEFKSGGEGIEIRYGFHPTPFGRALIAQTVRGVCQLNFFSTPKEGSGALAGLTRMWPKANIVRDQRSTSATIRRIFSRSSAGGPVRVFLMGTPFQLKVWEALLRISRGQVSSYGAIARSLGKPAASRAVGRAVGSNPVGFLIPCHRVIRETGVIGQYRWGSYRKHALLLWERSSVKC